MPKIVPVIMSGGAGSRLWPLSRKACPKQLLSLVGDETMLQQTVARFSGPLFSDPVFVCNTDHAEAISQQMKDITRQAEAIITEPVGRNTAPVAVIAALAAQTDSDESLVLLAPADHYVTKPEAFRQIIEKAKPAAMNGQIVTFGIQPSNPETGYGYIEYAPEMTDQVYAVKAFHEKPDLDTAKRYVEKGGFLWNAGLFLFQPKAFLAEMAKHAPEILAAATEAYEKASHVDGVTHLNAEAVSSQDWVVGAKNCLIESDGPRVAVIGVENIAVIVNKGVVSVVALDKAQDVKQVVTDIKTHGETAFL